jgi:16S rRNA (cytidine1402-2'-O)-methyltransferase
MMKISKSSIFCSLFFPSIISFRYTTLSRPFLHSSLFSSVDSEAYSTVTLKNTSSSVEPGHVYFVATPLGNLKDMTTRAIEVLSSVDLICAEDTRQTVKLLRHLSLPHKDLMSHHEHNWKAQIPKILSMIEEGKSLAVVSDAGTPG